MVPFADASFVGSPYALLYAIKPDGVRILAVMNLKRRPIYWIGRE